MTSTQANDLTSPPANLETQIRGDPHRSAERAPDTRPTHPGAPDRRHRPRRQTRPSQPGDRTPPPPPATAADATSHQPDPTSRAALALVTTNPDDATHQPPHAGQPDIGDTSGAGDHPASTITSQSPARPRPPPHQRWRFHQPNTSAGEQHASHTASTGDPDHQPTPAGGRLVAWTGFLFGSITSDERARFGDMHEVVLVEGVYRCPVGLLLTEDRTASASSARVREKSSASTHTVPAVSGSSQRVAQARGSVPADRGGGPANCAFSRESRSRRGDRAAGSPAGHGGGRPGSGLDHGVMADLLGLWGRVASSTRLCPRARAPGSV